MGQMGQMGQTEAVVAKRPSVSYMFDSDEVAGGLVNGFIDDAKATACSECQSFLSNWLIHDWLTAQLLKHLVIVGHGGLVEAGVHGLESL